MTKTIQKGDLSYVLAASAHHSIIKCKGNDIIVDANGTNPETYHNAITGNPREELEDTSCIGIYVLENNQA